jgi:hypothetical protein
MLIVFDDVISEMKALAGNQAFVKLFYNRRHLLEKGTISIIILGQKWNMVPTFIRHAYTFLITFPVARPQVQDMLRDIAIKYSPKVILGIFS